MGRVTDADAKQALGGNVAASKQTVPKMKAKIQGDKDKVKSWAITVLLNRLVVHAQSLNVKGKDGMVVTNIFGNGESWKHDDSMTNAEKMWNILFGQFNEQHGWQTTVESEVMTEYQWWYKELVKEEHQDPRNKSCIAKLISLVKGELVKNINKRLSPQLQLKIQLTENPFIRKVQRRHNSLKSSLWEKLTRRW